MRTIRQGTRKQANQIRVGQSKGSIRLHEGRQIHKLRRCHLVEATTQLISRSEIHHLPAHRCVTGDAVCIRGAIWSGIVRQSNRDLRQRRRSRVFDEGDFALHRDAGRQRQRIGLCASIENHGLGETGLAC